MVGYDKNMQKGDFGLFGAIRNGAATVGDWLQDSGFFRQTAEDGSTSGGWGTDSINALSGIGSAWLGLQQYRLAKDSFKENRRRFDLNYNNQVQAYNTNLQERERARLAAAGVNGNDRVAALSSYMKSNGI